MPGRERREGVKTKQHLVVCLIALVSLSITASSAWRNMVSASAGCCQPIGPIEGERKRLAVDLLADMRRLDRDLAAIKIRIRDAVDTSGTTLVELNGVGPIVAGLILGHVGDPARFPTPERFASYNGTAPIEASSGPRKRHRLNPRGNRKLNHAMHLIAVTQVRHDTPGHVYYQRKIAEGKTKKEALRTLKRRISDAVWRQLQVDFTAR